MLTAKEAAQVLHMIQKTEGDEMIDRNEMEQLAGAVAESIYRDAERYRWLRDRGQHFAYDGPARESPWTVIGINHTDCHPCSGSDLDEAVDAARAASVEVFHLRSFGDVSRDDLEQLERKDGGV